MSQTPTKHTMQWCDSQTKRGLTARTSTTCSGCSARRITAIYAEQGRDAPPASCATIARTEGLAVSYLRAMQCYRTILAHRVRLVRCGDTSAIGRLSGNFCPFRTRQARVLQARVKIVPAQASDGASRAMTNVCRCTRRATIRLASAKRKHGCGHRPWNNHGRSGAGSDANTGA